MVCCISAIAPGTSPWAERRLERVECVAGSSGRFLDQPIGLFLSLWKLAAHEEDIGERDARLVVLGAEFDGAEKLLVGAVEPLQA